MTKRELIIETRKRFPMASRYTLADICGTSPGYVSNLVIDGAIPPTPRRQERRVSGQIKVGKYSGRTPRLAVPTPALRAAGLDREAVLCFEATDGRIVLSATTTRQRTQSPQDAQIAPKPTSESSRRTGGTV